MKSVPYTIAHNTVVDPRVTPLAAQLPMLGSLGGVARIQHREYVTDIKMTDNFQNIGFVINATNGITFPWFATVAAAYEQYKILGMLFEFRSLSANALGSVGNPSMGSITFATQYDVYQPVFGSKKSANNHVYATSCKPSENMIHPVECDPGQTPVNPLSCRPRDLVSTVFDARLFDFGRLEVCTQGSGNPDFQYVAGELWVTFDILLLKPKLPSGGTLLAIDPPDVVDTAGTEYVHQAELLVFP